MVKIWYGCMIPKIIHQIWIGDFKIPLREKQLCDYLKLLHKDYEYKFWTDKEIVVEELPENLKHWYIKFYNIKNYAFCADLIRMWVVYTYGGFYLDIDFDVKNKLDDFLFHDGLFLYHNETDLTIPNNIFASTTHGEVLKHCLSSINFNNSWYGPSWFGQTIKQYLNLEYNTEQTTVKELLIKRNIEYYQYHSFEVKYAKHLSLYSWSPEIWRRLNNDEQL